MSELQAQPLTEIPQAETDLLHALGVRLLPEKHAIEFIFEITGIAQDEHGKDQPAGLKLEVGLKPEVELKQAREYERFAARIAETGISPEIGPGKLRPISWQEFKMAGYDVAETEPVLKLG